MSKRWGGATVGRKGQKTKGKIWPRFIEIPPLLPPIESVSSPFRLSSDVSVEEYFASGMIEYHRELAALRLQTIAQNQDANKLSRAPSFGSLGDVLTKQLLHLELITRATQTDWQWCQMALRWRHATILEPKVKKPPLPRTQIVVDLQPTSKAASPKLDAESAMTQHSDSISSSETDTKPDKKGKRVVLEPHHAMAKGSKHHHLHKKDRRSPMERSYASRHRLLRTKHVSHKCVDTYDLEFDPLDSNMHYTAPEPKINVFKSARCSKAFHQWKIKTRLRMACEQQEGRAKTETERKDMWGKGEEVDRTSDKTDRTDGSEADSTAGVKFTMHLNKETGYVVTPQDKERHSSSSS